MVAVFLAIAPNHVSEGVVLAYPIVRGEYVCVAQLLTGTIIIVCFQMTECAVLMNL